MNEEEFAIDPEEIEDFPLEEPVYQVWAVGYKADDRNNPIQDRMLLETPDPDEAENLAKAVYDDPQDTVDMFNDNIKYLVIEVEALVDVDGAKESLYNTYHRVIEITRK